MDYLNLRGANKGKAVLEGRQKTTLKRQFYPAEFAEIQLGAITPAISEVIAYNETHHIPVPFGMPDRVGLFLISHHPFFLLHPNHIHFLDGLK